MSIGISATIAAWLLTYTIHSTVLLGLAWLVTRRSVHAATADLIWKAAIVGALVTATVQGAIDVRPVTLQIGSRPGLPASEAKGSSQDPANGPVVSDSKLRGNNTTLQSDRAATGDLNIKPSASQGGPRSSSQTSSLRPRASSLLIALWSIAALLLALTYVARRLILVGRLGDREPIHDGALRDTLDALAHDIGMSRFVRLTTARSISSPIALGRAEICVPVAALVDLEADEQRGMLAHELAHLTRRDPLWLAIGSLVERVFFFQPLNRLARREMQTAAEYLCDEWSARRTGSPLALAKCLAKVAEWIESAPLGVPVAGMAEQRSLLVSRIAKLLETPTSAATRSRGGLMLGAVAILTATIAVAPGVSGRARIAPPADGITFYDTTIGVPGDPSADCCKNGVIAPKSLTSAYGAKMVGGSRDEQLPPDTTVVNALIKSLKDEDAQVRRAAAHSLGNLEDPRAVPALIDALEDSEKTVRAAAADALSNFEDTRAISPLTALLSDSDADVKQEALSALSNFEKGVSSGPVLKLLDDTDPDVRHQAVHLLTHIGDRAAVPALMKLIHDPSADVRQAVVEALGELGDDSAVSAITQALSDANPDIRHEAINALDNLKAPIPEATLLKLFQDADANVRQAAASLAGDRSVVAAIPALRKLLEDPDSDVREQAVDALSNYAETSARDAIKAALNSTDAKVRRRAAEALGRHG